MLLGNLLIFISRSVSGKILVSNVIEDLGLVLTHSCCSMINLRGFLSVSSIDTCVPVVFNPGRIDLCIAPAA